MGKVLLRDAPSLGSYCAMDMAGIVRHCGNGTLANFGMHRNLPGSYALSCSLGASFLLFDKPELFPAPRLSQWLNTTATFDLPLLTGSDGSGNKRPKRLRSRDSTGNDAACPLSDGHESQPALRRLDERPSHLGFSDLFLLFLLFCCTIFVIHQFPPSHDGR